MNYYQPLKKNYSNGHGKRKPGTVRNHHRNRAAAAAVAALLSLERVVDSVPIKTPLGKLDVLVEHSKKLGKDHGWATVRKMPYPDSDVTQNLEIQADVQLTNDPDILIKGGDGVGTVTKPGLQVSLGEKAINPVPGP